MRNRYLFVVACLWVAAGAFQAVSQSASLGPTTNKHTCACGAHPPAPPKDRVVDPYAGVPADLRPFAKFERPYYKNYLEPNIYTGAGRDIPDPTNITEVRIGFIGPIEHNPEQVFGLRMLHGAQLAVEEANARGGYGGKPFRLMLHNDYNNWQANAVYGDDRPTDSAIWGSTSDGAVKMIYSENDWAIFGSISSETTHIILRVSLKAETPIVNSASTDPTIPETNIPWYFTDLQDDRVQCLTLARRIYTELGLKRVAILRVNNRYGRMGVPNFRNASIRLDHPVVIEQKFLPGDTDFTRQLRVIQDSRADAVVLWTDEIPAARILTQMRALGMKQRVFGSYRTLGPELLAEAGPAAEGFEAIFPYDPTRNDPRWLDFNRRFEARFHEQPEQFASLAYDAMNMLLDSICKAGLNRARIQDALDDIGQYDGVTGHMIFDPNQKNVAPMYLGTVHNGAITYRLATMKKTPALSKTPTAQGVPAPLQTAPQTPYARVDEDGVDYVGPHRADAPPGPIYVVLFGSHAENVAQSAEMQAALAAGKAEGREWKLLPVDSDVNWSAADWPVWAATAQLVHALMDEHALAIIALDRDSCHLSTQMALKAFVPVVGLSNDKTLTSTNVPWIFRLPAENTPASALRLLEAAEKCSGANPEKLRDVLASGDTFSGVEFQKQANLASSEHGMREAVANKSIRVLVVEDHHVVRQGLVALLSVADGIEVVGEAADGIEAIKQFTKRDPDITLIDLRMPRMGGVEVIQRIRLTIPDARFIVLTTYDGDEDIYRALKAGVRAYLLKGMTSKELIAAIRTVHAGNLRIPSGIARKLGERMSSKELTPREFDVLEQIVHGKCNKDIAAALKISLATVKTHVNCLLAKLGVADRTQATTAAIHRGIVQLESLE